MPITAIILQHPWCRLLSRTHISLGRRDDHFRAVKIRLSVCTLVGSTANDVDAQKIDILCALPPIMRCACKTDGARYLFVVLGHGFEIHDPFVDPERVQTRLCSHCDCYKMSRVRLMPGTDTNSLVPGVFYFCWWPPQGVPA